VFLQRLDSSPLDLCCFSLHLCRLSPILHLLFRSLSLSRLVVSPLLTLLSFLDFSFVIHLTWSSHVTCDTCAESHSNDLAPRREIKKFIIRQPPMGEKDDYDSENSWISDGLPSSPERLCMMYHVLNPRSQSGSASPHDTYQMPFLQNH